MLSGHPAGEHERPAQPDRGAEPDDRCVRGGLTSDTAVRETRLVVASSAAFLCRIGRVGTAVCRSAHGLVAVCAHPVKVDGGTAIRP
jgi:hypothetical protein